VCSWPADSNLGVVTGEISGLVVVDIDSAEGQASFEKQCGGSAPLTPTVKTPKGTHYYFKHPGVEIRNSTRILPGVDVRGDGGFVVTPPSASASGLHYEWIVSPDTPLAPLPQWVKKHSKSEPFALTPAWEDSAPILEGERNARMYRLTRSLRLKGLTPEAIRSAVHIQNRTLCQPSLPEEELDKLVTHALTQPDREDFALDMGDLYSGHMEKVKLLEVLDPIPTSVTPDVMPADGFIGIGRDYATLYGQYLESPESFLYFSFLTYLGAITSRWITLESELSVQPRLYTVLIGESGITRKSTAIAKTHEFFKPLVASTTSPKVEPCLVTLAGVGSAEGLAEQVSKQSGQTQSLQSATRTVGAPFLLRYDELKSLVAKSAVKASTLLPMIATCFEQGSYANAVTSKSDGSGGLIEVDDASISLLGASTLDTYSTMFSQDFLAIGLPNRLWTVKDKSHQSLALPKVIPAEQVAALQNRVKSLVTKLCDQYAANGHRPIAYPLTDEAMKLWEEWYATRNESILSTRLDTYGHRLMVLLTVTSEKKEVDLEVMQAVVALLKWQLAVRLEVDPIDADDKYAKVEIKIRRMLQKYGSLTDAALKRHCQGDRIGAFFWGRALGNLKIAGEIERVTIDGRLGWKLVA
jgi:hypothetical protein